MKRKHKRRVVLFMLLALCGLFYTYFAVRLKPALIMLAQKEAVVLAQSAVNEASETLAGKGELLECSYHEQGRITLISCNTAKLNELRSAFSGRITELLRAERYTTVRLPLGTVLGSAVFSGRGPEIALRLVPVSDAVVDLSEGFSSGGINQTFFEINAAVTVRVRILLPFFGASKEQSVSVNCPFVQTVLSGEVPEVYYAS